MRSVKLWFTFALILSFLPVQGAAAAPNHPGSLSKTFSADSSPNSLLVAFQPHPELSHPMDLADPNLVAYGTGAPPVSDGLAATGVDDRSNTDVTPWYVYEHWTSAQILSFATSNNLRVVDLYVESQPDLFTAVFVANSGSYQKSWWFYINTTPTDLYNTAISLNARIVVLKAFDDPAGSVKFYAVLISNTGSDYKTWWFYQGQTVASLTQFWQNNNARIVQINSYVKNNTTYYDAVLISNTGADQASWYWYVNTSVGDLNTLANADNARIIDLDIDPATGNYNAVLLGCGSSCPYWWWYVNVPTLKLLDLANQNGARIIDANSLPGCSDRCWSVVMINNSNAITSRVGQILRSDSDGMLGLYLKQVGGPVLANLMDGYVFEPASAIKAVTHLYAMRSIMARSVSQNTLINKYAPPVGTSCPGNTPAGTETLDTADKEMMWHSDNTRTRELNDYFGTSNVNLMAANLGLTHTAILHVVGCGGPPSNQTTLDDLGSLYENVALANTVDAARRSLFFANMAGKAEFLAEGYDWTGLWSTSIPAIIQQEAPLGSSKAFMKWFQDNMDLAYKAGNYNLCNGTNCTWQYDIAIAGWAKIPFCNGTGPAEYVFGVYISNASSSTNSSAAFNATKAELLREQIHAGLASCAAKFHLLALPVIRH